VSTKTNSDKNVGTRAHLPTLYVYNCGVLVAALDWQADSCGFNNQPICFYVPTLGGHSDVN